MDSADALAAELGDCGWAGGVDWGVEACAVAGVDAVAVGVEDEVEAGADCAVVDAGWDASDAVAGDVAGDVVCACAAQTARAAKAARANDRMDGKIR